MTHTLQQRTVAEHIHKTYGDTENWPFHSAEDVQHELGRRGLGIGPGDYLVIGLDNSDVRCGKACGLKDLAAFPPKSLIISYHELERAFHEQYTDWIEV